MDKEKKDWLAIAMLTITEWVPVIVVIIFLVTGYFWINKF